jgi:hypothetical protein
MDSMPEPTNTHRYDYNPPKPHLTTFAAETGIKNGNCLGMLGNHSTDHRSGRLPQARTATVPPDQRQPQSVPHGKRAILLVRRDGQETASRSLADALETIITAGYDLVGVLDPSDYREAHRLVAVGMVDVIVVARTHDLPSIRLADQTNGRKRGERDRTQLVQRGGASVELFDGAVVSPNRRRPRRVR